MRDGWTQARAVDVIEINPRTPGVTDRSPFITMAGVSEWGRWARSSSTRGSRGGCRARGGDTLVARITPCLENGKIAQVPREWGEVGGSTEFIVLRSSGRVLPDFVYLWAQSRATHAAAIRRMIGTTGRQRVSSGDFGDLPILVPPIAEQRRIVDLIGTLDDAIDAAEVLSDQAESLWWRLAADLQEKVSRGPAAALGDIADIGGGLTKNAKDAERADAVEAPYLRVANVLRRRLDLSDVATIRAPRSKVEATQLLPGDVLMNEGGDKDKLGRGAVWRGQVPGCTHQNHVFRARLTNPAFSPDFVSAWANSFGQRWFETHGTQTTGIASINKSTLSRFPVPDIPLAEQLRWADLLQSLTDQEDEYRAQAKRLRALRSSVLTALLSGEHEIPDSYDELMEVAS